MKIENCLKDALDSFYQREFDEAVPETAYDNPRRILIAESNPAYHKKDDTSSPLYASVLR